MVLCVINTSQAPVGTYDGGVVLLQASGFMIHVGVRVAENLLHGIKLHVAFEFAGALIGQKQVAPASTHEAADELLIGLLLAICRIPACQS